VRRKRHIGEMENLTFASVLVAVLGANVLTAVFVYGFRRVITDGNDFIGLASIIVPAVIAVTAALSVL